MLQFILLFALILFLSAIAINGFYNIIRGDWHFKPDGTKFWDGMIFSFWSKFLQQHTIEKEFYNGSEWYKQFSKIKEFFADSDIIEVASNGVIVQKMDVKRQSLFNAFAASKEFLFTIRSYDDGVIISSYKEVKKYKIPMWVQMPLGGCITCLSSVAGTICWIFWYFISVQVQYIYPTSSVLIFLGLPLLSKTGLWIFFCISLAYINEIVFNTNHSFKK